MTYHIRVRAGAVIIENDAILLVEFNDHNGLHYNFPAGGAEPGESVVETAKREAWEEAGVEVEVGPLAFVYEYTPHLNNERFGSTHSLGLMFDCKLVDGSTVRQPAQPDPFQTGVKWIPLSELENIVLYPNVKKQILEYASGKREMELLEEHRLEQYVNK
ncbi:NUDIX domain-containing protein [Bacillus carboniphilus]|uniref:NUDIX domain-containing protein n=1 Tax=Bacillus carboniphilus TaxID=86663 RepID=A0ABP3FYN3_9BACI